jgi:hypothetical protein
MRARQTGAQRLADQESDVIAAARTAPAQGPTTLSRPEVEAAV